MKSAFILGGTSGLGLELVFEAVERRNIMTIIAARSAKKLMIPARKKIALDLTDLTYLPMEEVTSHTIQFQPEYLFWVSGIFSRKPLSETDTEEIESMAKVHLTGPIEVLKMFHKFIGRPYHLITIASTSSWRMRENETIYCALKAAKAHFTRNFAKELFRDYPGSKVTLIHPGGMKTGFFNGTDTDPESFMDPAEIAGIIWDKVQSQESNFDEIQIMRNDDGTPNVTHGPRLPELP